MVIVTPTDDYDADRHTIDAQGRIYLNTPKVVNDEYVADRIHRYLPSGALDQSFGSGGYIEVPGQNYAYGGRNVAVDDKGRLWFARQTYLDVLEVRRFLPNGVADASFTPVEQQTFAGGWDPVGDIVADGDGVVLGYSIIGSGGTHSSLSVIRIASDGAVTSSSSSILGNMAVRLIDVSPEGWVSGRGAPPGATTTQAVVWNGESNTLPFYYGQEGSFDVVRVGPKERCSSEARAARDHSWPRSVWSGLTSSSPRSRTHRIPMSPISFTSTPT